MTEIQTSPLVDLVHIRPGFPGESERIDRLLEATGLRVAVFTDVYRGLARLARLAKDGEARSMLRAVLVQVDDLGPPEMEFFSITSRVLARTPVLVYGSDRLQSRVELALERGATDRASPEIITRLAARDAASTNDDTADRDAPAPMPMAQPGQPGVDLESDAAAEPVLFPEVVRDDPPPRTDQPENETTAPTRVPWLDYETRPVRQAPRRTVPQPTSAVEPNQGQQPNEAGAQKVPDTHEPLLTEEELRALIGDDISSIAPSETEPNEIAGPAEERGDA